EEFSCSGLDVGTDGLELHLTTNGPFDKSCEIPHYGEVNLTAGGAGYGSASFEIDDCPELALDIAPDATEVYAGETIGTTFSITNDGELDTPVYFVSVLPNDEGLEWSGDL